MKYLTKNKYWELDKDYNIDKLLYLLVDRSTHFHPFYWVNNIGEYHRNYDLPAMVWRNGIIAWGKNNKKHRKLPKPAIIHKDGYKEHWLQGKQIK